MERESDGPEVIRALNASRRLPRGLDGWNQQAGQHPNSKHNDQRFDERKATPHAFESTIAHVRSLERDIVPMIHSARHLAKYDRGDDAN
jgi:hypothetical protein